MAKGDHIKVRRFGLIYAHHGIDLGDGTVAHYIEAKPKRDQAKVMRTSREEFLAGGRPRVVGYAPGDALSPEEVARRAMSQVDAGGYHLAWNNCEHFATWCKTGRARSSQVKRVLVGAGAAGLAMAVLVVRAAITRR